MNKKEREVMEQALEALEYENSWHESFKVRPYASTIDAVAALRAALAQQAEPVEPVYWEVRCAAHPKWMRVDEQQFDEYVSYGWEGQKLYTAPPQRKPLPLKDVERLIYENTKINPNVADDKELLGYIVNAIRVVERAHNIVE